MSEIPKYVEELWNVFLADTYGQTVKRYSRLFNMALDPSRAPFIFAGNLENEGGKILTFGLAPHAGSEHVPQSLEDYYAWRRDYFKAARMPHQLHGYFARLCWGILGIDPPSNESEALRWLHE